MGVDRGGCEPPLSQKQKDDLLYRAVRREDFFMVLDLLEQGAYADARDPDQDETCLIKALFMQSIWIARALLDAKADVRATCSYKNTPLHAAAYGGLIHFCQKFVEQSADIDAQNDHNSTSLMLAAEQGHKAVCRYLVNAGADIELVDNNGATACVLATENTKLFLQDEAPDIYTRLRNERIEKAVEVFTTGLPYDMPIVAPIITKKSLPKLKR